MDIKKVITEIDTLYYEIDKCISDLINARVRKDDFAEGQALFRMESLMVNTMQLLSVIREPIARIEGVMENIKHAIDGLQDTNS